MSALLVATMAHERNVQVQREVMSQPPGKAAAVRLPYGDGPLHYGDLRLPVGAGPCPVVVLIHGGFWRAAYDLTLMDALGDDLARRGIASWNIEYRRVGDDGGGWPGTLLDVAAATDALRTLAPRYRLGLDRVVTVGHSAGGHLALWLAARPRLATVALAGEGQLLHTGSALPVRGAVSLAGVADLEHGWRLALGRGAVAALLGGGPCELPERYAVASPAALLPLGVPQVLVQGLADEIVPPAIAEAYVAAATAAGDDARLRLLPGVEHFAVIDPASAAWRAIVVEIERLLAGS